MDSGKGACYPGIVRCFAETRLLACRPALFLGRRQSSAGEGCKDRPSARAETTGRASTGNRGNQQTQEGSANVGRRRRIMKRTRFTYGQLDKVLRSYGFSCRVIETEPPVRLYEHKATGAEVSIPPYPFEDNLLD